jgi:hypothetical protein
MGIERRGNEIFPWKKMAAWALPQALATLR